MPLLRNPIIEFLLLPHSSFIMFLYVITGKLEQNTVKEHLYQDSQFPHSVGYYYYFSYDLIWMVNLESNEIANQELKWDTTGKSCLDLIIFNSVPISTHVLTQQFRFINPFSQIIVMLYWCYCPSICLRRRP